MYERSVLFARYWKIVMQIDPFQPIGSIWRTDAVSVCHCIRSISSLRSERSNETYDPILFA